MKSVADAESPLYARILGADWQRLPAGVRQAHLCGEALCRHGVCTIEHGKSLAARLLIFLMRLPPAGAAVPTTLIIDRFGSGERWTRHFDRHTLRTAQSVSADGLLVERFGLIELVFQLQASPRSLLFRQVRASACLGPFRISIPRVLGPQVSAEEWGHTAADDAGHLEASSRVLVRVTLPWCGLLIEYDCRLRDSGKNPVEDGG